jgi:hypothetical protein
VRLKRSDKARILEAAGADGLASWVRKVLLRAVGGQDPELGEPTGPANGSQPTRPETRRPSAAAGSRR